MRTDRTFLHSSEGKGLKRTLLAGTLLLSMFAGAVCVADNKPPVGKELTRTQQLLSVKHAEGLGLVTVAAIRKAYDGKSVQVLFNERAQIFTLDATRVSSRELLAGLEEALKKTRPLVVTFDDSRATIKAVARPSAKELELFRSLRQKMLQSEKPQIVDLEKIDTTHFNDIKNLKFPVWKLCLKTVPNYTKAKEIFDYCAKQSCNLPGPYLVTPCIPFQYVRDGCYARAHKMKWLISQHFGYCSEKVFSFANSNNDDLAVVASKWGGCCVTWWYHVAPVIQVKTKILIKGKVLNLVLAYVIDPGMFDKPVLLSTWLRAQENTTCSPHAKVSAYTIQPSSAYSPANYQGTTFTTDPQYISTNATLINYQNLTTCN
ncbi:MAG: protein-glutamine glutaminase family protein [Geobacteraceae bacterium]